MLPLLLAACMHPAAPVAAPAPEPSLHVVVLGDRTGEPDDAVWAEMVAQAGRLRPDLVLTVGDLADDADDEADWARALAPLQALEAAGIEVQPTPGNHDIHDGDSAARFERLTGERPYRSFDRGGVHFVVLDNSIANTSAELPDEQLAWLDADLAAHGDGPVIVLMHKPFWAKEVAAGAPDPLHERFVAHGVRAVLTGHWHRHAHQRIDGIDYVIVGSSGGGVAGVPSAALGTTPELLWMVADGTELALATITEGGVRSVERPSLADEDRLNTLWRHALHAELSPEGTEVRLVADAPVEGRLLGSGLRVGTEGGPGPWVALPEPAKPSALPRVEALVDLPDAGLQPWALVPDWPRVARATTAEGAALDGDLSEWTEQTAAVGPDAWTTLYGQSPTADPTTLWVGYGPDALWLAARCDDRAPDRIKAMHPGRDGQAVYDDRIGVLLAPADDQLFWVYLTAAGAAWDLHADRAAGTVAFEWDATEVVASRDTAGWQVEARIPWAALGLDGPPERMGFDARRKQEHLQAEAVFTPAFAHSRIARLGTLQAP